MRAQALLVLLLCGIASSCDDSEETAEPVAEAEWETLVGADWTLPPGTEGYVCARKTISEDLWVSAFGAVAPPGTHHTVLTYGPPTEPDGVFDCNTAINHDVMIYGSGVGSRPFTMPEGVAVRIPAGQQLLLNLHLFNTTAQELSGSSAITFQKLTDEAREQTIEAEAILAGPTSLDIPPGEHSITGGCTLKKDATLFAVGPHMHQLGVHMTVTAHSSDAGSRTILDVPYSFDDQQVTPIPEAVPMRAGDFVEVRCDYRNNTNDTVTWGESSLDEMCFAGLYRYPRDPEAGFVCFQ
jgi:hypothetical protein